MTNGLAALKELFAEAASMTDQDFHEMGHWIKALSADPKDSSIRRVYSDWLEDHGWLILANVYRDQADRMDRMPNPGGTSYHPPKPKPIRKR